MNPINAKSVQLVELHAFAYCLLFVYLSESFDYLEVYILNPILGKNVYKKEKDAFNKDILP